jgi:hypothetical protein
MVWLAHAPQPKPGNRPMRPLEGLVVISSRASVGRTRYRTKRRTTMGFTAESQRNRPDAKDPPRGKAKSDGQRSPLQSGGPHRRPSIRVDGHMSAASRQIWISITSGIVATMIMLGIVGWNGGHPHPYYWGIVVILTVSCVLACKRVRPRQQRQPAAKREHQAKGARHAGHEYKNDSDRRSSIALNRGPSVWDDPARTG